MKIEENSYLKNVTIEDIHNIFNCYISGEDRIQIADKYNVSVLVINRILQFKRLKNLRTIYGEQVKNRIKSVRQESINKVVERGHSDLVIENAIADFIKGDSVIGISEKYKIRRTTIYSVLDGKSYFNIYKKHRKDINGRKKQLSDDGLSRKKVLKIIKLYLSGDYVKDISIKLKVGETSVYGVVNLERKTHISEPYKELLTNEKARKKFFKKDKKGSMKKTVSEKINYPIPLCPIL